MSQLKKYQKLLGTTKENIILIMSNIQKKKIV